MRKNRSLLVGLGIGLMLGASMLQLMTAARQQESQLQERDSLSLETVKKDAEGLGYSLLKLGGDTYSQEQLDEAVKKAADKAAADAKGAAEKALQESEAAKPDAPAPSREASKAEKGTYHLYIAYNDDLTRVASNLEEMGLIADKAAFLKKAKPQAKSLQVGLCTFQAEPTFDEIIAELTRRKH
ncbi:endolytic transglycosylase MltG [Cohnella sp. REN36]|uniref:endolytic transglycosylase MltG n=1 Tax=Cohnella sp. REN36 TaxID=2887347 RepID=UPI001D13E523|nr:endolytic transglycosylase MltG [Cohnella sp. REN36]MCC3376208.1 endolytic transglycosylase MltG [Cohnella sp. REN36]